MASEVVEVVARFGETLLVVAHLGPSDSFHIGTAPHVDVVVPGLTSFPLVACGIVSLPVGVRACEHDGWTELRFGALSLHLTRTRLERAALDRSRFEWRPVWFAAASLIAHVTVWLLATTRVPVERVATPASRPRLARIAHLPAPKNARPSEPKPVRAPALTRAPVSSSALRRSAKRVSSSESARAPTTMQGDEVAAGVSTDAVARAVGRMGASFDRVDVAKQIGELGSEEPYIDDAANARGFGGGRSFDPSEREGFESIETGPYATMMYDVKTCPEKSCRVEGPIPALFIRTHLHAHMRAIYDCYMQHAEAPGTILLEFTITADGAVRDARGSGLGETGSCAARVASGIYFKALGNDWNPPRETRVRYPVRFNG